MFFIHYILTFIKSEPSMVKKLPQLKNSKPKIKVVTDNPTFILGFRLIMILSILMICKEFFKPVRNKKR